MVGESPHWYEVEVNEETRATKFVLKSDPMWAKTKWSYWLAKIRFFKFGDSEPPLRDKPNGEVIEESANLRFYSLKFLKADGDWAYVEGYKSKTYRGWIRWRKGRDMLVKDSFNLFNVAKPKIQMEENN